MRFLGFDPGTPTPDDNTIRHFRNRLTETGTLKQVMKAFDWQLQKKGYIPRSAIHWVACRARDVWPDR
ncbi:MAG: transposase [Paracoccaceae bacterium]